MTLAFTNAFSSSRRARRFFGATSGKASGRASERAERVTGLRPGSGMSETPSWQEDQTPRNEGATRQSCECDEREEAPVNRTFSAPIDAPGYRSQHTPPCIQGERQLAALIAHLRRIVVHGPGSSSAPRYDEDERFHVVFLGDGRDVLGEVSLGEGGARALTLRMRDLFGRALGLGASGMILAHNHPSGDSRPSKLDIDATCRLAQIARALDIELLDHLIFTESAVYSMRAGDNL